MNDREKREAQENVLYDTHLASEILKAGRTKELAVHLAMAFERGKNGMSEDEVDAVKKRAETAAKMMTSITD